MKTRAVNANPWFCKMPKAPPSSAPALSLLTALAIAIPCAAQGTRVLSEGDGPDIAVDKRGNLHLIYLKGGSYRYRVLERPSGALSPERNTGFGVEFGSLDRGYGFIEVDPQGAAHIFTGMGYARFAPGASEPQKKSYGKRDPAMAMTADGRILLAMRGHDKDCQYCGDGTIVGAFVEPGTSQPGPPFNLDAGLNGRNSNVYPGLAAGPDGAFHLIYRHGPQDKVWYRATKDGKAFTGGAVPIADDEGPRIAVGAQGRVLAASGNGSMVERSGSGWVPRGNPVGGEERSPPSLAADDHGNIYATHGGNVSVLPKGSNAWTPKAKLPGWVKRRTHDQSTHLSNRTPGGVYAVYEGKDGIYVAFVSSSGDVRPLDGSVTALDPDAGALPARPAARARKTDPLRRLYWGFWIGESTGHNALGRSIPLRTALRVEGKKYVPMQ